MKFVHFLSVFLIFLLSLSLVRADVGIGIRWKVEELYLNEFEEKCVVYTVYNPFDSDVKGKLSIEKEVLPLVSKIEPEEFSLPGYKGDPTDNKAKLANNQNITVCFKANPLRWLPFYPINYSGVVLATATPINIPSMGSASASVVQAPLTLKVGNMATFYQFVIFSTAVLVVLILLILKIKKKLPKIKKRYCSRCKKWFSLKMKYCPECGRVLK